MGGASWLRLACLGLLAASFCGLSAGCSSKGERARVKGRVKFLDKYLTAGTIAFNSKDGSMVGSSTIDIDGNYEVSDAPVGDTIITIKVPSMPRGKVPKEKPKPPPGVPEMKGESGEGAFAPLVDPDKIVQIPGKYGSVETSGLTYTVSRGDQEKNISLSP